MTLNFLILELNTYFRARNLELIWTLPLLRSFDFNRMLLVPFIRSWQAILISILTLKSLQKKTCGFVLFCSGFVEDRNIKFVTPFFLDHPFELARMEVVWYSTHSSETEFLS